jgi:hypothetical protein
MLETIANSSLGIWIVALLIILLDSAVLLEAGEYLFQFGRTGTPELRIPQTPFLLRNKELVLTLILYLFSFRAFFRSSVIAADTTKGTAIRKLRRLDARCAVLHMLAASTLFLLATGPLFTTLVGLSYATMIILAGVYVNGLIAVFFVWKRRKYFVLTASELRSTIFEIIVCPILVVNIVKRLTGRPALIVNTWQVFVADEVLRDRIKSNLEYFDTSLQINEIR